MLKLQETAHKTFAKNPLVSWRASRDNSSVLGVVPPGFMSVSKDIHLINFSLRTLLYALPASFHHPKRTTEQVIPTILMEFHQLKKSKQESKLLITKPAGQTASLN